MSFITLDFKCQDCGEIEERFVRRSEVDSQVCSCMAPDKRTLGPMIRLMPGPSTTFKMHDRSAIKSKKAVSLRDPNYGASPKGHSKSLD